MDAAMQVTTDQSAESRARAIMLGGLLGLGALLALGIYAIVSFVEAERDRAMSNWQIQMGLVAESRAEAVNLWLDEQLQLLTGLAQSTTLRLYMTQLDLALEQQASEDSEGLKGYLRNQLLVTAERHGYAPANQAPPVAANVDSGATTGIALYNRQGNIVAASANVPDFLKGLKEKLLASSRLEGGILDYYRGRDGQILMAFAVPVFAVQGNRSLTDMVGRIVAVRPVAPAMFERLEQPGAYGETAEAYLVARQDDGIAYLSPLADGTAALSRILDSSTPDLAAAALSDGKRVFGSFTDYRGEKVLATARRLTAMPWYLVYKLDRQEALGATDARLTRLMTVLLLIAALVATALIAAWRHGTSQRARAAAQKSKAAAEQLAALNRFLNVVTDAQPTVIAAVDKDLKLTFANRRAEQWAGQPVADLIGKSLTAIFGAARARPFDLRNSEAIVQAQPIVATQAFNSEQQERQLWRAHHVPLPEMPGEAARALMVLDDITQLVQERERREATMQQMISTLVQLVDRRDPFSADHSQRVADVAGAIAEEMDILDAERETVLHAASLVNIGKIFVPRHLLVKDTALTADELALVQSAMRASADLLEGIDFGGPVVETLRQLDECVDGHGAPNGLKGDDILLPARIVAVANKFVAMTSARAYRPGVDFALAEKNLVAEMGTQFDTGVVSALLNLLNNRDGRTRWAHFALPPQIGEIKTAS